MVYEPLDPPGEPGLDAVFAALAHPARRALMRQVLRRGAPMGVGDLAAASDMSPQLLNKHATTLERAGLITRERIGREKRVHAHPEALDAARGWIEETSAFWSSQLDALERYVATMRDQHGPADQEE